jgi:5-methyltetrahydropteroyltriglutamate--homocysteine methyltransferase
MTNLCTHILGFPRIGSNRELKKAVESYWRCEISQNQLEDIGKKIREDNWKTQHDSGIHFVTVGDFSWYDHILDTSALLGVIPKRFKAKEQKINLNTIFCMARGQAPNTQDAPACEMTKWFNTNYHYIVPEFIKGQEFKVSTDTFFEQIDHAISLGYRVKPVLVGPLTYLWLGKAKGTEFNKLELLKNLLLAYNEIFQKLKSKKIEWFQLDEPILTLELSNEWKEAYSDAYKKLDFSNINILLTTYFGSTQGNLELINNLPVQGLHIDLCSAPEQIESIINHFSNKKVLSAGVISGRNIWKSDIYKITSNLKYLKKLFEGNLWISSSCSLLHSPVDLDNEKNLDNEIKSWLSFAKQKTFEIKLTADVLNDAENPNTYKLLMENHQTLQSRYQSNKVHNPAVQKRVSEITASFSQRKNSYKERAIKQKKLFNFPLFPTTTIGSFPQTQNIRSIRHNLKAGKIDHDTYVREIQKHIADCILKQESLDLDVLVHGEAERNDMVEYFGELLDGFAFTSNGWVQSYGSRCVKPPIIYGDVTRPKPMTIDWAKYSQSLTKRPVKGMLTGPVTILSWSFVRDDQLPKETALQIALALRDETIDLEKSGIKIIQIDEPAFREALPLQRKDWQQYLNWAVNCFRISASGVDDDTQIHTHMCYSEFNDIIQSIADLDADVITIECSRSDMELLQAFESFAYPNEIGPGVYDIHSPSIPETEFIVNQLEKALKFIPEERLWINPDCGLKTRNWFEVEKALRNMTDAAKELRKQRKSNQE